MTSESPDERRCRDFFEQVLGMHAERVEETDEKRADYLVRGGCETFVVEVKSKDDDQAYKEELQQPGRSRRVDPLRYSNTISSVIRDAGKQVCNTPRPEDAFHLLWLTGTSSTPEIQFEQFIATLYGVASVFCTDGVLDCFYFDHNEFIRHPHIQAAVVMSGDRAALCINTFAPRLDEFTKTKMAAWFTERSGIRDPRALEVAGNALLVDKSIPRKDDKDVVRFLKEKYGERVLNVVRINAYRYSISVERA